MFLLTYFFQKDTGEIRGHSAKLFNKRSRLDIRNTFSHTVIFVTFSLRATMLLHLNLNTVVDTSVFLVSCFILVLVFV